MKGIYLTEEGKQAIETKITKLELVNKTEIENKWEVKAGVTFGCILMLKEILSSATILPVEESWDKVIENVENDSQSLILQTPFIMKSLYEQGVIIQPKQ
jgi:hypothetical protein